MPWKFSELCHVSHFKIFPICQLKKLCVWIKFNKYYTHDSELYILYVYRTNKQLVRAGPEFTLDLTMFVLSFCPHYTVLSKIKHYYTRPPYIIDDQDTPNMMTAKNSNFFLYNLTIGYTMRYIIYRGWHKTAEKENIELHSCRNWLKDGGEQ